MSLLELFLHFRDMHHLVRLRILVPNLELCLVFYKLKMSCLSLRLSFDQFSHLVDHFLILGEELGSVINFLLQVALGGHEHAILLIKEDTQRPAYCLLEEIAHLNRLSDEIQESVCLIKGAIKALKSVFDILRLPL